MRYARGALSQTENIERREQGSCARHADARCRLVIVKSGVSADWSTRLLPDMSKQQAEALDYLCSTSARVNWLCAIYWRPQELMSVSCCLSFECHIGAACTRRCHGNTQRAAKWLPESQGARFVSDSGRNPRPVSGDPTADRAFDEISVSQRTLRTICAFEHFGAPAFEARFCHATPLPDKPSIAVLPFQNMSGDPE